MYHFDSAGKSKRNPVVHPRDEVHVLLCSGSSIRSGAFGDCSSSIVTPVESERYRFLTGRSMNDITFLYKGITTLAYQALQQFQRLQLPRSDGLTVKYD